jgi:hypothetical protein
MPIFLEIEGKSNRPPTPKKFNHSWLNEEDFKNLVKITWKSLEEKDD